MLGPKGHEAQTPDLSYLVSIASHFVLPSQKLNSPRQRPYKTQSSPPLCRLLFALNRKADSPTTESGRKGIKAPTRATKTIAIPKPAEKGPVPKSKSHFLLLRCSAVEAAHDAYRVSCSEPLPPSIDFSKWTRVWTPTEASVFSSASPCLMIRLENARSWHFISCPS